VSRGCSGCRQTEWTRGYAPRTKNDPLAGDRRRTTPVAPIGRGLRLSDGETDEVGDADVCAVSEAAPSVGSVDRGAEVHAAEASSSAAIKDVEPGSRTNTRSRYRGSQRLGALPHLWLAAAA